MGEEEKYLNYPLFDSIISRLFFSLPNFDRTHHGQCDILSTVIFGDWESTKEQAIKGVIVSGVSFLINNFIFLLFFPLCMCVSLWSPNDPSGFRKLCAGNENHEYRAAWEVKRST